MLEDLRLKKEQRVKEFSEIQLQIVHICAEIAGDNHSIKSADPQVNECNLTIKKLEELKLHLRDLQDEKVQWNSVTWSFNLEFAGHELLLLLIFVLSICRFFVYRTLIVILALYMSCQL